MSSVARVTAQAKVNLFLRVLAREQSGYHQIETLFCRLALGDEVTVRVGGRERDMRCTGPADIVAALGAPERNLAQRAATAFAAECGWPDGWAIEIDKRIPVGGGLGGGSADAGAVLRALNALAPEPVATERLLRIAASLGSDVPFLTMEAALAFAWGRGERMLALPALLPRQVTLYCFDFGVPTADAYSWLAASRVGAPVPAPVLLEPSALSDWSSVGDLATNDFEMVVGDRHPEIRHLLLLLRDQGGADSDSLALLSGSGSTVFVVGDESGVMRARAASAGARILTTTTASHVVAVARMK